MERDYRLASVLGGLAGTAAVVFLATLALAGSHLGNFLGGGGYLRPHHASHLPTDDDTFGLPGGGGCKGPCKGLPVQPTVDPSAGSLPILGDFDQAPALELASDEKDTGHRFQDGSDPSFFWKKFGGGFGSGDPEGLGYPPRFIGGGGGGGGGGGTFPGGGTTPPGGGTPPPGGGVNPPGGGPPPTVPEPATWALFMIGAGAIGAALRASRPR